MDGTAFDAWTRRRVGLAASGLLTAGLGFGPATKVAAKKCKGGKKKCHGKCIGKHKCCGGCGDLHCCQGKCVDLVTSTEHCGQCGNACPSDWCLHGACGCENFLEDCPAGVTCSCGAVFGGGGVCFSAPFLGDCDEHADCPVGSACLVNGKCSGPCVA